MIMATPDLSRTGPGAGCAAGTGSAGGLTRTHTAEVLHLADKAWLVVAHDRQRSPAKSPTPKGGTHVTSSSLVPGSAASATSAVSAASAASVLNVGNVGVGNSFPGRDTQSPTRGSGPSPSPASIVPPTPSLGAPFTAPKFTPAPNSPCLNPARDQRLRMNKSLTVLAPSNTSPRIVRCGSPRRPVPASPSNHSSPRRGTDSTTQLPQLPPPQAVQVQPQPPRMLSAADGQPPPPRLISSAGPEFVERVVALESRGDRTIEREGSCSLLPGSVHVPCNSPLTLPRPQRQQSCKRLAPMTHGAATVCRGTATVEVTEDAEVREAMQRAVRQIAETNRDMETKAHAKELASLGEELARVRCELEQERQTMASLHAESAAYARARDEEAARFQGEREAMWAQFKAQQQSLAKLTGEVAGLKSLVGDSSTAGSELTGSFSSETKRPLAEMEEDRKRDRYTELMKVQRELLEELTQEEMHHVEPMLKEHRPTPQARRDSDLSSTESEEEPLSRRDTALTDLKLPPFSQHMCSSNAVLSKCGYLVTRAHGSRQCLAVGPLPLEVQKFGHYFEVEITKCADDWVGGLGIGVTHTHPTDLQTIPEKAWRIPNTFVIGYWGCAFLDGEERSVLWRPDELAVGSRIGLLLSCEALGGDLLVFVDGRPVVRISDATLRGAGLSTDSPLFPTVDVFAATLSVALQASSRAPPPPWHIDPAPLPSIAGA